MIVSNTGAAVPPAKRARIQRCLDQGVFAEYGCAFPDSIEEGLGDNWAIQLLCQSVRKLGLLVASIP
jgi:hypothetical protein